MAEGSSFKKSLKSPFQWIGAGLILLLLVGVALGPITSPVHHPVQSSSLQMSHVIGLAMFSFAQDHGGAYPAGKSSTDVFQQLIDGGYMDDPTIFYSALRPDGKFKATSKKLKPENVCWDVTVPVDDKSLDSLPLVFITGYRVNYVPGGSAVPLFSASERKSDGIPVCYLSNTASFRLNDGQSDGVVTNFISPDFDPAGKKYQQLTPDGPLAP